MEDTNARMIRLGRNQLFGLPHLPLDERLARVEAVTRTDIAETAARNLAGPRVVGAVGPLPAGEFERYLS